MFRLCRDLGISNPVEWMNNTPPKVVNLWIAFYMLDDDKDDPNQNTPEQALEQLMGNRWLR